MFQFNSFVKSALRVAVLAALVFGVVATSAPHQAFSATLDKPVVQTAAAWDGNFHPYTVGTLVSFQGNTYRCIQSHTSQPDWTPAAVAALWTLVGPGGGATPTSVPGATATRTPVPGATATRTPTRAPTLPPPPPGSRIFAPYLDTSPGPGSANGNLAGNMNSISRMYTLAFILGRGCTPAWNGIDDMNSANANAWATRISALRAAGGDVLIAFGGAAAPELAEACPNVAQLQAAYQAVVTKYSLRFIDLDIESFGNIDIRSQALAGLQRANPNLRIHYTLGVLETGLTQPQLDVLNSAKRFGLRVDLVNIMAMDYGHAVGNMEAAAESAARGTRTQLNGLGMTSTQLGITPMIGQNDSGGEIFTLANAQTLVAFARNNGVALMAFWSIGRDNGGCPGQTFASATCSGVSQSSFQFSSVFRGFP